MSCGITPKEGGKMKEREGGGGREKEKDRRGKVRENKYRRICKEG